MEREEEIDQFKGSPGDHAADTVREGKGIEKAGSCDL